MLEILAGMLDRRERSPTSTKRWEVIDWGRFATVSEADDCKKLLAQLADDGVVELKFGRRGHRGGIEKVSIIDAKPIYHLLGRVSASQAASDAIAPLRERSEPWESEILAEIESKWATNSQWQKIPRSAAHDLLDIQKLAQAIRGGVHVNQDFRTFSARVVGDSKKIERRESAVLAYLGVKHTSGSSTLREIMAAHGSEKITLPVLLSGPVEINGLPICDVMDYVGVPVQELDNLSFTRDVEYVLTIENLTSFHRHAVEINPLPRRGLVLFTSGQPSNGFKAFYSKLVERLTVPFYHWSDIDGGGLEITRVLMNLNSELQPHLMDIELLERHGTPSPRVVDNFKSFAGWLRPLAEHLSCENTKTLEQETVDPRVPVDDRNRS